MKRFDRDSDNYSITDNKISFSVDAFKNSDTGTYIGIYYSKSSTATTIYIAGLTDVNVKKKEVNSITVTSPTKTTYMVGETLDVTGGKVNITYNDDSQAVIDLTEDMVSDWTSSKEGVVTATVIYNNKTTTFDNLIISLTPELNATYGDVLANITLPKPINGTFSWQDDKNTKVGSVGNNIFKVKFVPNDSKYSELENIAVTLIVAKATPEYDKNITLNATYGDTLSNIQLPTSNHGKYEFEQDINTSVGNAGTNNQITVKFTPNDTDNYQVINNIPIIIEVAKKKATSITIPTLSDITYNPNVTLSTIPLPEGWTWDNPNTVPTVDNNAYKATYTPKDTTNYNIIKDIEVTLQVTKSNLSVTIPNDIIINESDNKVLADIQLPDGWKWLNPDEVITKSGKYQAIYEPEDLEHYNPVVADIAITFKDETNANSISVAPKTGDKIIKYFIGLSVSIIGVIILIIKLKNNKNSL